jgi:hypothetical protein
MQAGPCVPAYASGGRRQLPVTPVMLRVPAPTPRVLAASRSRLLSPTTIHHATIATQPNPSGKFHENTPETSNYVRTKVAFCTKFVPFTAAQLAAAKAVAGTAPLEKLNLTAKALPPANVAIAGNGTVWQYLYKNKTCNLSAGIQVRWWPRRLLPTDGNE